MPKVAKVKQANSNLGFEEKLWKAADKMRSNMDAAEYKHIVLGLIFLKYISDAFDELYTRLSKSKDSDAEDRDEYIAENIFYVPKKARWKFLQDNAKKPEIGRMIDDAMDAIEKENPKLKGVLPKIYGKENLDKARLGELIDLIGTIGLGDKESKSKDILGRVYEYFLGQFADAEGKSGGQFYTPRCIVKLLVQMLEPYKGRVFDPCCGSGGMFVQSEEFVEAHGGRKGDIAVYGQESNQTTWRLAMMNLSIRGIDANIAWNNEGSFISDGHPQLKADFIMANPPFNDSDWSGDKLRDDPRWKFGVPPAGNANFAWVQHFISHLSPSGTAGFLLANGSMSSNTSGEGEIRKNIIEAGLVDCMLAMPSQLFYNTMIPVSIWFVRRRGPSSLRPSPSGRREGVEGCEILFIDARNMGKMIDRRHREMTEEDIKKISDTYHAFRSKTGKYEDIKGFCKAAKLEEVKKQGYILTPGRYVGTEAVDEDPEVFDEKMKRLTKDLGEQFKKSKKLEEEIKKNLKGIGYEI